MAGPSRKHDVGLLQGLGKDLQPKCKVQTCKLKRPNAEVGGGRRCPLIIQAKNYVEVKFYPRLTKGLWSRCKSKNNGTQFQEQADM